MTFLYLNLEMGGAVCLHAPAVLELRKLRLEDPEVETSLLHSENLSQNNHRGRI